MGGGFSAITKPVSSFGHDIGSTSLVQDLEGNPNKKAQAAGLANRNEQAYEQGITNNLTKVDDSFGVGTDQAAQTNANGLHQWLTTNTNNLLNQNQGANTDALAKSVQANDITGANSGSIGSSQDANNKSSILSNYLSGNASNIASANIFNQNLQTSLNSQRYAAEDQVSTGAQLNPNITNTLSNEGQALSAAQSNIPLQTLGNTLSTAGTLASQNATAQSLGGGGIFSNNLTSNNLPAGKSGGSIS